MRIKDIKPGWSLATALMIFVLLWVMVLYQQTVFYLGGKWNELSLGNYAHGYLVLAISIYLIIYNRKKLAQLNPCPSYAVLPLVFLMVILWLAAVLIDVEMMQTVGLLGVVFTVTWAMFGHQVMKVLAFPILFIVFAIPVWFPLSPLLQNITADVVFWFMRVIEVPAFRQENLISIPSGVFSIEEACSGLRYFLAALTLGSLFAYLNYKSLPARIAVVLVAAGAAVLANIIRVIIVVYLGYTTEMQHPWVNDHLMMGWYLFGALMAVLLVIDAGLYRYGLAKQDAVEENSVAAAGAKHLCSKRQWQYFTIAGLCVTTVSIGPVVVSQQNNQQQMSGTEMSDILPARIEGWSDPITSKNDWMPQYYGAISKKYDYLVNGKNITLFIAYYPFQKQGAEMINDLNSISNKKIWATTYSHSRARNLYEHDVMEQVVINSRHDRLLIWYWYNLGGQITVNKYEAKILQLAGMLLGQAQAYMVAVAVPVDDDIEQSRELMQKLVNDLKAPLEDLKFTDRKYK